MKYLGLALLLLATLASASVNPVQTNALGVPIGARAAESLTEREAVAALEAEIRSIISAPAARLSYSEEYARSAIRKRSIEAFKNAVQRRRIAYHAANNANFMRRATGLPVQKPMLERTPAPKEPNKKEQKKEKGAQKLLHDDLQKEQKAQDKAGQKADKNLQKIEDKATKDTKKKSKNESKKESKDQDRINKDQANLEKAKEKAHGNTNSKDYVKAEKALSKDTNNLAKDKSNDSKNLAKINSQETKALEKNKASLDKDLSKAHSSQFDANGVAKEHPSFLQKLGNGLLKAVEGVGLIGLDLIPGVGETVGVAATAATVGRLAATGIKDGVKAGAKAGAKEGKNQAKDAAQPKPPDAVTLAKTETEAQKKEASDRATSIKSQYDQKATQVKRPAARRRKARRAVLVKGRRGGGEAAVLRG